jgi:UDP-N-acetylglucosamine 2-epimerase (non-hydrolysing)
VILSGGRQKIIVVAGARPNFMKIAPILRTMGKHPEHFDPLFVHTGQHYDDKMSRIFLDQLGLPDPYRDLGVGSGSHGAQTGQVLIRFEEVAMREKPDRILVVGDVNSTIACALAAAKLHIPVAHVEAGLRSNDRTMPEEINRILTDQISDMLFIPSRDAAGNLLREGRPEKAIHFVGNVMIESLILFSRQIDGSGILRALDVERGGYGLVTLHRPSNVDEPEVLKRIFDALARIGERIPVLFPAHPRTVKQMQSFGLEAGRGKGPGIRMMDPLGYFDFLCLEKNAALVLTDSGGVQEETTFFQVPCITLRENTERPVTLTQGTNMLAGSDSGRIIEQGLAVLDGRTKRGSVPEFWDDRVSERIVRVLMDDKGILMRQNRPGN